MLSLLEKIPFWQQSLVLALFSGLSIVLLAFRIYYSGTITYFFLYWNLFLAIIPFVLSLAIYKWYAANAKNVFFFILLAIWLLFFPNAPYIVTDFIHLKQRHRIPYWYDILLIFTFAYNGIMLALSSLRIVHIVLIKNFGQILSWLFVFSAFFLTGFGIYLGRYLRWNSWDIITNPLSLLHDIYIRFSNPGAHPATFGITFIVFWFLFFSYLSIIFLSKIPLTGSERSKRI